MMPLRSHVPIIGGGGGGLPTGITRRYNAASNAFDFSLATLLDSSGNGQDAVEGGSVYNVISQYGLLGAGASNLCYRNPSWFTYPSVGDAANGDCTVFIYLSLIPQSGPSYRNVLSLYQQFGIYSTMTPSPASGQWGVYDTQQRPSGQVVTDDGTLITVRRSGGTTTDMWTNGSNKTTDGFTSSSGGLPYIGWDGGSGQWHLGNIGDIIIYDRALTDSEVSDAHTALLGLYPQTKFNAITSGDPRLSANTRTDGPYQLGFFFTVGVNNLIVTDLGRWVAPGAGSYTSPITLYDITQTSLGSVMMDQSLFPEGGVAYLPLSSNITLTAGSSYYLYLTSTGSGDDPWYDNSSLNFSAAINAVVLSYGSGGTFNVFPGNAFQAYGFPSFRYHL